MSKEETISGSRLFGIGEDHAFEHQSLDQKFVQNKASTFFFAMRSNAMAPLFMKEDVLIVDRSKKHEKGKVALVFYQNEMVCRRIDFEDSVLILRSDNSNFQDITIHQDDEVKIFGVVIGLARHL
jgi:DNA polymerase V